MMAKTKLKITARKILLILGMGMVAAASKNQLTVSPGLPPVI